MTSGLTRLHITPLTPDLLPTILGPASAERAQNISYHQVQTFPESNYGYVDLPTMDAEKVKRKLNGATLKGKKIKIEEAKPRKRKHEHVEAGAVTESTEPKSKSTKRKKNQKDVLSGHELAADRIVKRGWTASKKGSVEKKSRSKSDQQKSKYTDKDELLFRTKVPSNKAQAETGKRKKSTKNRDVEVVHEFEKSAAAPSFLKESGGHALRNLQYIDGQGWVTEDGAVLEPEPSNVKAKRTSESNKGKSKPNLPEPHQDDPVGEEQILEDGEEPESDDDISKTSSSSTPLATPHSIDQKDATGVNQSEVHPLEALFKKPKRPASSQDIAKPSLELATSNFSFFDGGDVDDVEEELSMPGTPFSSQDIRSRGLRSAAPTPDTAHPSRFNSYGSSGLLGDEDDESEETNDQPESSTQPKRSSQAPEKGQPSEFEKMFWEKRGDNNRAWKARRRAVLKDKRQRENRSRRPKNW